MAFADISLEEALVLEAYEEDILDEEETLLPFELLDKSKDPILHRNYARFDLNQLDETECEKMFRFSKEGIPRLAEALRLPDKFTTYQGTTCDCIEGLCLLLRRLAYPCRYVDLIPLFGRPKQEISMNRRISTKYRVKMNSLLSIQKRHID